MIDGMELSQLQTVQMKVSPRLVAMNHVLELSSMELQELINTELSENPALEMLEKATCPRCGAALDKPVCPHCLSSERSQETTSAANSPEPEQVTGTSTTRKGPRCLGVTPRMTSTPWSTSPPSCRCTSA
jgi:DNA-directed RNA polymerase specialized sigma54-like protein